MSENIKTSVGAAFWIVGILLLLWNIFGCYLYIMDMTMSDADYAKTYGDVMAELRPTTPIWVTAFYAIAVWSGLLASLLLLLRKKWAVPLYVLSMIGIVISMSWGIVNADMRAAAGTMGIVMPIIVGGIGLFQIWWSRRQSALGRLS